MRKIIVIFLASLLELQVFSQLTQYPETNLETFSTINSHWYAISPSNNTLGANYYQGINFGFDANNYVSLVNGVGTNDLYFGRWSYSWKGWNKIWHSGNLNRNDADFLSRNFSSSGTLQTINKDSPGATWDNLSLWTDGENSYIYANGDEQGLHIKSNGGNKIILESNVGVGTSPGNYKLNVWGTISTHEIVVNTTGADFVFDPTYKLPTLSELEAFVKEHKHLPDIAPAEEMQENGVSVSEMQKKLLQKVEETTLYLIEQSKQIEALKKENENKDKQLAAQQHLLLEMKKEIEVLKSEYKKSNSQNNLL